jgi:hypothetical protein
MGQLVHRCNWRIALLALAMPVALGGCWPGRCGGALRGTPRVGFGGEQQPCSAGPTCAEAIDADHGFHQKADFRRVEDPAALLEESGINARSWFLVDERGAAIPSQIEPIQHESAHSCASAAGFNLQPEAPLEPGVYRLVLLVERVRWPLLRGEVELGSYAGEPALVQYYRVDRGD